MSLQRLMSTISGLICLSTVEARALKTIEVGLVSNFSAVSVNSYNPFGNGVRAGADLALSDLAPMLSRKGIRLVMREMDCGSSVLNAKIVAQKAADSNVIAVVGYEFSDEALIAAPIHVKSRLLMLTPSASADRLGRSGIYVRQASFPSAYQGKILAKFATQDLRAKRALIVTAVDCSYCQILAEAFESELKRYGGQVTQKINLLTDDREIDPLFASLDVDSFDVVMVPNHELTSVRIITAMLKRGIRKPYLGGDGWRKLGSQLLGAGRHFEGYMLAHWHPSTKDKRSLDFVRKYRKKNGLVPTDSAVLVYDALQLLGKALIKISQYNRVSLAEGLATISSFQGVSGKYIYPAGSGSPYKTVMVLKSGEKGFEIFRNIEPEKTGRL